jgi:hypothetical protein
MNQKDLFTGKIQNEEEIVQGHKVTVEQEDSQGTVGLLRRRFRNGGQAGLLRH